MIIFLARTSFGSKIGMGHFKRILNFFTNNRQEIKGKLLVDHIDKKKNFDFNNLEIAEIYNKDQNFKNEIDDAKIFVNHIKNKKTFVLVDDYRIGEKWEKIVSKYAYKIITIDDFVTRKHFSDFYINTKPGINFSEKSLKLISYNNKKNSVTLLGSKFAIIKKSLIQKKKNKKFIITFYNGASGNLLIYENIIINLCTNILYKDIRINIILGPYSKNQKQFKKIFKNNSKIEIIENNFNIGKILEITDLLISSAGVITFESAYYKVPSIFFQVSKNQKIQADALSEIGHHFILEKKDLIEEKKINLFIHNIIKNYKRIKKLIDKPQLKIDGSGSKKILNIIKNNRPIVSLKKNLETKPNNSIVVKKIQDQDINNFLHYRNKKINLKNSFSGKKIKRLDHYNWWFDEIIKDAHLVLKNNKPIILLSQKYIKIGKYNFILPSMISCDINLSALDLLWAIKFQNKLIDNSTKKNKISVVAIKKDNYFSNQQCKYFNFKKINENNKFFLPIKDYINISNCNLYMRFIND